MADVRIDWLLADDVPAAQLIEAESWLTEAERARAARFLVAAPRREYVLGRWLARRALAAWTGSEPTSWTFVLGPHGRPEPRGPAAATPNLNLSHGGGLVVCASALQAVVGVDVEGVARDLPTSDLHRFFAPDEAAALLELDAGGRHDRFWRLWTLKEAWLKARGTGVAGGLASFSIRFRDPDPPVVERHPDAAGWILAELRPTPRHRLAIAARPAVGNGCRWRLRRVAG